MVTGAGSPFGVTVPNKPYIRKGLFRVKSYVESLHSGFYKHLRSAVPFSSQVLPLLGHPYFAPDGSWGILGVSCISSWQE